MAISLWDKIKTDIRALLARLVGTAIADDVGVGTATISRPGELQRTVPRARGSLVSPGDQVLVLTVGGREVVVCAIGGSDDEEEPPLEAIEVLDALGLAAEDNSYLARLTGQWVWHRLERVHAIHEPWGLSPTQTAAFNTNALVQAANHAASIDAVLVVDGGEYPINPMTLPEVIIEGAGSSETVFLRSSDGITMTVSGSLAAETSLSTSAPGYSWSVQTATNPGLARGDMVRLRSDRTIGPGAGALGFEVHTVDSVTGSGPYTINLDQPTLQSFNTSVNARIGKITPKRPVLTGFTIRGVGTPELYGVQFTYCRGPVAEDIAIENYYSRGFYFFSCLEGRLSGFSATDPHSVGAGEGYGVLINTGSRDITVEDFTGRRNRHLSVVTAGSSFITFRNGRGYRSTGGDFDLHGHESRHVTYENCVSHDTFIGFICGNETYGPDTDIRYLNCGVHGSPSGSGAGFMVWAGSTRVSFVNCFVEETTDRPGPGFRFHDSSDLRIQGGRVRFAVRGVDGDNTTGVTINGMVFHNIDNESVRSTGTSNYWQLHALDQIATGAPSLVGANNIYVAAESFDR